MGSMGDRQSERKRAEPALQCPDCGARHPISTLRDGRLFPCRQCERMLKVPDVALPMLEAGVDMPTVAIPQIVREVGSPGGVIAPAPTSGSIQTSAPTSGDTTSLSVPRRAGARLVARVPTWLRALVWAIAFPLGLIFVALAFRFAGLLDVERVGDVVIERGGRLLELSIFLVCWATVSATLAHGAIETILRRMNSASRTRRPTASRRSSSP